MWHLFPDMQVRGYDESHFYDQYQPRWSASRSSRNWQAVEKPNRISQDQYTEQDLIEFATAIGEVQRAGAALNINLTPASELPLFARGQQAAQLLSNAPAGHVIPPMSTADSTAESSGADDGVGNGDVEMGEAGFDEQTQGAQGEQTSSAGQEEYEGEANGLPPPQKSDDEMSVHESDDEELDLLMHRAGHIETAAMGILPGYSTEKKLPMFHRSDLTPAGERDAQTVRFELHPLTHEPHTSQMPGDHGIIDPNSDIYEFRGPLVQVFSMPKKRPLAAMVCNTDVCKFCNPTLGDDYQITTPSRTNGLPFIHTGLDLGQTGLDRDTQTQYSMYDAVPLQSKERMDIAAYSTYIPIHLVQCKVRANWPIWTMTGCVPQECNVCRNLEGKTKVWSSDKKEVTWA